MTLTLSTIIALIVLLILIVAIIVGVKMGFLRILFTTFSLVVTIVAAALLADPIATILNEKTFVGAKVEASIGAYIEDQFAKKQNEISESLRQQAEEKALEEASFQNDASGSILSYGMESNFIKTLALPSFLKNKLAANNTIEKYTELGVSTFAQYITVQLSALVMKAIAFILLFIVISLTLNIIYAIAKLISKIPIIHGANRILGGVVGLLEGLLAIWCICILIMILSGTAAGTACMQVIQDSKVLTFIYDNNIPVIVFKSIFTIL